METFSNILVAVDLSDNCVPALKQAVSMAEDTDATVTGLFVVPSTGEEITAFEAVYKKDISRKKLLENYAMPRVEEWMDGFSFFDDELELAARVGDPAEEIVEYAVENQHDLIVMGTHGRSGFKRLWIGSVAERVTRTASCPVLVIRSKPSDDDPDVTPERDAV
jgi:nucleotide-binding universal stress UspA family protein